MGGGLVGGAGSRGGGGPGRRRGGPSLKGGLVGG